MGDSADLDKLECLLAGPLPVVVEISTDGEKLGDEMRIRGAKGRVVHDFSVLQLVRVCRGEVVEGVPGVFFVRVQVANETPGVCLWLAIDSTFAAALSRFVAICEAAISGSVGRTSSA
jgi:hypothetical protein